LGLLEHSNNRTFEQSNNRIIEHFICSFIFKTATASYFILREEWKKKLQLFSIFCLFLIPRDCISLSLVSHNVESSGLLTSERNRTEQYKTDHIRTEHKRREQNEKENYKQLLLSWVCEPSLNEIEFEKSETWSTKNEKSFNSVTSKFSFEIRETLWQNTTIFSFSMIITWNLGILDIFKSS
jgi:hypothetical protein